MGADVDGRGERSEKVADVLTLRDRVYSNVIFNAFPAAIASSSARVTVTRLIVRDAGADGPAVTLAADFEDVERAEAFVQANINPILNACYALFLRVGADLEPRTKEGLTVADAMQAA